MSQKTAFFIVIAVKTSNLTQSEDGWQSVSLEFPVNVAEATLVKQTDD
jgi:hypothetical protein